MKKVYLLGALLVLSLCVSAQTVIPKIGFALAKIKPSEDADGLKSKLGLTIGAAVDYPLMDNFSLQGELLFVRKGVKFDGSDFDGKHAITYLEIPVLFKASFDVNGMKVYGNAGPSLSFALGGKYEFSGGGDSESGSLKFGSDEESDYKGMDFGFQIGGGIVLMEKYQIDLRYGLGLSNISPVTDGGYTEKNRTLQITFGMPLNLFN
jgi:hypothetical protein